MSPTSYQTAPPRIAMITTRMAAVNAQLFRETSQARGAANVEHQVAKTSGGAAGAGGMSG
jgi:hypothetical protein